MNPTLPLDKSVRTAPASNPFLANIQKYFLLFVFMLSSVGVWGQTATITIDLASAGGSANLGSNAYASGAERTWTQNTVSFGSKATTAAVAPNLGAIQAQANNGVLYNTTALPGRILSIVVTSLTGSTDRTSTLTVGDTGRLVNTIAANYTVTGGTSLGATTPGSWTIASGDYTYFAIKRGESAAYWQEIKITYETTASAPVITSLLTKATVYGTADTYVITASGSPTSYNATPLPAGFTFSGNAITKANNVDAGTYTIPISATRANETDTKNLVWTVTKKALTITGLSGANKVYDGTSTATLTGTAALNGKIASDDVTLSGTPIATFANKNVGSAKAITVTGYTLTGAAAGNYTLTQPTGLSVNITAKPITVTNATVQDKVYDGNTTATVVDGVLAGVISPDVVTVSGGGTFADANAGTGKTVTASLTLAGADAGNYTLTQPTGLTGTITKATPVFTTSPISLNVGGTYTLPGTNVVSTSNGALSYAMTTNGYATLAGTTITGVAAGTETLMVTQAASTNYIAGGTTVAINVIAFAYLNGDVRSKIDGDLSNAGVSYWEEYSAGVWTDRTTSPQNVKPLRLIINKVVGGGGNVTNTYNDIIVVSGGTLNLDNTVGTLANFIAASKKLEIQAGGKVILNGQIKMNGTANLIVKKNGILTLNSPSIDNTHSFWAGIENFQEGSTVNIKNWNWAAIDTPRPLLNSTSQISNNSAGYKFGNLIIDTEVGDNWTLAPGSAYAALKLCENNLEISNTSATNYITGTSNNSSGFVINGDFIIYDGWFNFGTTFTGDVDFTNYYVINGDFKNESNDNLRLHYRAAGNSKPGGSITILGDLVIGDDVLQITNQDFKKIILKGGTAINPKKIEIGTLNVLYTPFEIADGYRILKKNLSLGTNSSLLVKTGATLNFGFDSSDNALNIVKNGAQIGMSFTNEDGSTLKISSPDGLRASTTPTLGNVQTPTRTFSAAGIYHYIGKASTLQVTGDAIATATEPLTGKIIVDMDGFPATFAASASRTINTPGVLDIRSGIVTDVSSTGFIGTGNLEMKYADGRYITGKTGTQPALSGTYNLKGGTIEFANSQTTAAEIRTTPDYFNVNVSGSSVKPGGLNLNIKNLLNIKPGGLLTIPAKLDAETPYVVIAKKGLQVTAGGQAVFENNANLMQDADAVNSGSIIMKRSATMKKMDYTYWSSPVSGQKLLNSGTSGDEFSPGTPNNRIFRYNEPNDKFYATTDPNFVPGKGYAIRGKDGYGETMTPDTFTFTGIPNNGDNMTVAVQRSADSNGFEHGYNLIGNPYPSGLNFNLFHANTNNSVKIDGKAWFWSNINATVSQTGSVSYTPNNYAVYSLTGGTPPTYNDSSTVPGNYKPDGNIKVGQAFIVKVTSVTGPTNLEFKNIMRTTGKGAFYNNFKNTELKNRYWLRLISPDQVVNTILLAHLPEATDAYDRNHDADLFTVGDDSFYSLLQDRKMQIQARGEFTNEAQIPLGTQHFKNGAYKIELETPEGIFTNDQTIYLHDKMLNTYTNLNQGHYSYEAEAGFTNNRFEIVYKPGVVLATDKVEKDALQVYRNGDVFVVQSKQLKIDQVEVYDMAGRLVMQVLGNSNEVRIESSTMTSGIYILKIKRGSIESSRKILK